MLSTFNLQSSRHYLASKHTPRRKVRFNTTYETFRRRKHLAVISNERDSMWFRACSRLFIHPCHIYHFLFHTRVFPFSPSPSFLLLSSPPFFLSLSLSLCTRCHVLPCTVCTIALVPCITYTMERGTAAPARLFIATCTIIYRNKRLYTSVSGF